MDNSVFIILVLVEWNWNAEEDGGFSAIKAGLHGESSICI